MKQIYKLLTILLLISSAASAQIGVLRIEQTDGTMRYVKQSNMDSIVVSPIGNGKVTLYRPEENPRSIEIDNFKYITGEDCDAASGLYIGVIGFNDGMTEKAISGPLYSDDKSTFNNYINNLTSGNGTVLYHAVNSALDKAIAQCAPYNLGNISIVTFTDGLDQGSWFTYYWGDNEYANDEELLSGVSSRISTLTKNEVPISAYTIGIKGEDITDEPTFRNNLTQLSSSADKVSEVTQMSQVTSTFSAIAEKLNNQSSTTTITTTQNMTFAIAGQSPDVVVRFTFDNVSSADNSNLYIEGTFTYAGNNVYLTDVIYEGMVSTSGTSIAGVVDGNVKFAFEGIATANKNLLIANQTQLWSHVKSSSVWQITSEFVPDQNTDTEIITDEDHVSSSAIVLLVLDCSNSLGDKFDDMQSAANNFVEILLDGAGVKPTPPSISTTSASSISFTLATVGGNVTNEGSSTVLAKGIEYSTMFNFTGGTGTKVASTNTGLGSYSIYLTGLTHSTTYYYRSYAANSEGTTYGSIKSFATSIAGPTDKDGNTYGAVQIGTQVWMSENLRTTKYPDGSAIPHISDEDDWADLEDNDTDDAFCKYGNSTSNAITYGYLYTYAAALSACPTGWHLPGRDEWLALTDYLVNDGVSSDEKGTALKSTSGWNSSGNGTDDYGFAALPGGIRSDSGLFQDIEESGYWWRCDFPSIWPYNGYLVYLRSNSTYFSMDGVCDNKSHGYSVRCLKDSPLSTTSASNILMTSATVGGGVIDEGSSSVYSKGIEYSTVANFTGGTGTKVSASSTGIGSFSINITGLIPGTTYYYHSYATNSEGTNFGSSLSFTTATPPVLSTTSASSISFTSATVGGYVIDEGSSFVSSKGIEYSTVSNFTEGTGTKVSASSTGIGSFSINITGLTQGTTYYYHFYATNSKATTYGDILSFTTATPWDGSGPTDIDGNTYGAVQIGTQVWMSENLRTTQYPDGTSIPKVTDEDDWADLGDNDTDDAYCAYDNSTSNATTYGYLYTYAAATNGDDSGEDVQGVCPDGWHLPSDDEWKTLEMYIGMSETGADDTGYRGTDEGTKLKSASGWNSSGNGTDDYGFAALPGGGRSSNGSFYDVGRSGFWWSSTEYSSSYAYTRILYYSYSDVYRDRFSKSSGYSVRCLRD